MAIRKKGVGVRKKGWRSDEVDTLARESRSKREDSGAARLELEDQEYFSDLEPNGTVVSPYGVLAFVEWDDGEHLCKVDQGLVDGKRSILAPGDQVLVSRAPDSPMVTGVRQRRTTLSRPASRHERERVIAANIDCVVIVASAAHPAFKPGLIDRYLIAAQVGGATPIICINKMDLVEQEPGEVSLYRDIGIVVIDTSCKTGKGLDRLRDELANKLAVFAGHSGVGKSSIVNALDSRFNIVTQEISQSTMKGRHTTTASRLYHLEGGIRIIDTPGIRQLGLWGVSPAELDFYFHELAETGSNCRFRDCTHSHEPNCAVRAGVESGEISAMRYASYLRIRKSLEESTERENPKGSRK